MNDRSSGLTIVSVVLGIPLGLIAGVLWLFIGRVVGRLVEEGSMLLELGRVRIALALLVVAGVALVASALVWKRLPSGALAVALVMLFPLLLRSFFGPLAAPDVMARPTFVEYALTPLLLGAHLAFAVKGLMSSAVTRPAAADRTAARPAAPGAGWGASADDQPPWPPPQGSPAAPDRSSDGRQPG